MKSKLQETIDQLLMAYPLLFWGNRDAVLTDLFLRPSYPWKDGVLEVGNLVIAIPEPRAPTLKEFIAEAVLDAPPGYKYSREHLQGMYIQHTHIAKIPITIFDTANLEASAALRVPANADPSFVAGAIEALMLVVLNEEVEIRNIRIASQAILDLRRRKAHEILHTKRKPL